MDPIVVELRKELIDLVHNLCESCTDDDEMDRAEELILRAERALKMAMELQARGDFVGALEEEKKFLSICSTGHLEAALRSPMTTLAMTVTALSGTACSDNDVVEMESDEARVEPPTTSKEQANVIIDHQQTTRDNFIHRPRTNSSHNSAWSFFRSSSDGNRKLPSSIIQQVLADDELRSKFESEVRKSGVVTSSGYRAVLQRFILSDEVSDKLHKSVCGLDIACNEKEEESSSPAEKRWKMMLGAQKTTFDSAIDVSNQASLGGMRASGGSSFQRNNSLPPRPHHDTNNNSLLHNSNSNSNSHPSSMEHEDKEENLTFSTPAFIENIADAIIASPPSAFIENFAESSCALIRQSISSVMTTLQNEGRLAEDIINNFNANNKGPLPLSLSSMQHGERNIAPKRRMSLIASRRSSLINHHNHHNNNNAYDAEMLTSCDEFHELVEDHHHDPLEQLMGHISYIFSIRMQ